MEWSPDSRQKASIEEAFPEFIARFRVGQIAGEKRPAPAGGDQPALQLLQCLQEMLATLRAFSTNFPSR